MPEDAVKNKRVQGPHKGEQTQLQLNLLRMVLTEELKKPKRLLKKYLLARRQLWRLGQVCLAGHPWPPPPPEQRF